MLFSSRSLSRLAIVRHALRYLLPCSCHSCSASRKSVISSCCTNVSISSYVLCFFATHSAASFMHFLATALVSLPISCVPSATL